MYFSQEDIRQEMSKKELIECIDMIEKSMDVSDEGKNTEEASTMSSSDKEKRNKAKARRKKMRRKEPSKEKADSDFFIEIIIDELKRENKSVHT